PVSRNRLRWNACKSHRGIRLDGNRFVSKVQALGGGRQYRRLQRESRGRSRSVKRAPGGNVNHGGARSGRERRAGRRVGVNFSGELRYRAGLHQGGANRVAHEVMHGSLLAKPDFGFRGMNVDVHLSAGQLQKQEYHREHRGRNNVTVSLCKGVLDEAVANQASVDEDVNGIAIEFLDFGFRNEAVSAQLTKGFFFLLDQIFADGACTKRKSAGVTLLLFPPPRWGLRQADSFKRLQGGDG